MNLNNLTLSQIAALIESDWKKVNFAAKPYLDVMFGLQHINDRFMFEDARSIVLYFLGNATSWKGETAKAVKAELKARLKNR